MTASSQTSLDTTPSIATDVFFAEQPLIDAIKAGVPGFVSVGGYTDLPTTIESAGPTPAAFVVYEGSKDRSTVPGAAIGTQLWTVAVLTRKVDAKGAGNRAVAGPLLAQVVNKLSGLRLQGCTPLTLYAGPQVKYYPGGQAVFYVTFALSVPMLSR